MQSVIQSDNVPPWDGTQLSIRYQSSGEEAWTSWSASWLTEDSAREKERKLLFGEKKKKKNHNFHSISSNAPTSQCKHAKSGKSAFYLKVVRLVLVIQVKFLLEQWEGISNEEVSYVLSQQFVDPWENKTVRRRSDHVTSEQSHHCSPELHKRFYSHYGRCTLVYNISTVITLEAVFSIITHHLIGSVYLQ